MKIVEKQSLISALINYGAITSYQEAKEYLQKV